MCCRLKEFGVFGEEQVMIWPESTFPGEEIEGAEAGFPCQFLRGRLSWNKNATEGWIVHKIK